MEEEIKRVEELKKEQEARLSGLKEQNSKLLLDLQISQAKFAEALEALDLITSYL